MVDLSIVMLVYQRVIAKMIIHDLDNLGVASFFIKPPYVSLKIHQSYSTSETFLQPFGASRPGTQPQQG